MSAGFLSAERHGPHIKFTVQLPEGHDHFALEILRTRHDEHGNPYLEWQPLGEGFVEGDTEFHMAKAEDPEFPDLVKPLPEGRYRALAYRRACWPGTQVRVLETSGEYTNEVTV